MLRVRRSVVPPLCAALVLLAAAGPAHAQAAPPPEPAASPGDDSGRRRWIAGGVMAGCYLSFATWAYFAWYHDQPDLPEFTVGGDGYFGENTYAGGADKVGHFHANVMMSRAGSAVLRWGGVTPWKANLLGGLASWATWTLVEIKDGYYYQFSPGDLAANSLGVLTAIAMDTWPRFDELVDFRTAYFPSPEYRRRAADGDVDVAEDYSGQTYLLALHLGALPGLRRQPYAPWLRAVDLTLGFESRGYKPDPPPGVADDRSQHLFIGLSLNLQGVIDLSLEGRPGRGARFWRQVGHGTFEFVQLPYTTLPVVGLDRSPDDAQ